MLMNKLDQVLKVMDLELCTILIDNIHRLPSPSSPRPVIVRFYSHLDRDTVWSRRSQLANATIHLTVREPFPQVTEQNIRKLLLIGKAALQKQMKVKMSADKLYINSPQYTASNLHQLPDNLKAENITVKELANYLFFYSAASLLSNFNDAAFKFDSVDYINSEQHIIEQKARLANAPDIAKQVMATPNPGIMKKLTRNLPGLDSKLWHEKAPGIGLRALKAKFSPNPHLAKYIFSTGDKILIEASPYNRVWGLAKGWMTEIWRKKYQWGQNLQGKILMEVRGELLVAQEKKGI